MRSTPGREADSTEHVPPPESTPAQFSRPADERRPAPPPMADSWDAVLSRDPQAPRSADPWAPAADSEQEELWTPPGDTVYRRGSPREATLSGRVPSQADPSATPEPERSTQPPAPESVGRPDGPVSAGPEPEAASGPSGSQSADGAAWLASHSTERAGEAARPGSADLPEPENADRVEWPSSAAWRRGAEPTGRPDESARMVSDANRDRPAEDPSSSGWTASSWMTDASEPRTSAAARPSSSESTGLRSTRDDAPQASGPPCTGTHALSGPQTYGSRGSDVSAESDERDDAGERGSYDVAEAMSRWSADGSAGASGR